MRSSDRTGESFRENDSDLLITSTREVFCTCEKGVPEDPQRSAATMPVLLADHGKGRGHDQAEAHEEGGRDAVKGVLEVCQPSHLRSPSPAPTAGAI